MKIAVLGCGAMGMLIGGYLSKQNEVTLIDVDENKISQVNQFGILIDEKDGSTTHVFPKAVIDSKDVGKVDIVIMFVKSMFSESALKNNYSIIGEDTYILTLQNGAGHEEVLKNFVKQDKIIIGATNQNSSIKSLNNIFHGGAGDTYIGLCQGNADTLSNIAENFSSCGINTSTEQNIRRIIWNKLFVNVSISALTAVLQVKIGYMEKSLYAKQLMRTLVSEAVAVANAEGMKFDEEEVQKHVYDVVLGAKEGLTSIYADIRDGRKTEVDTISGFVVKAGQKIGIQTPSHEFIVNMIHALEDKTN